MKRSIRASMLILFGLLGALLILVGPVWSTFVFYRTEDLALEAQFAQIAAWTAAQHQAGQSFQGVAGVALTSDPSALESRFGVGSLDLPPGVHEVGDDYLVWISAGPQRLYAWQDVEALEASDQVPADALILGISALLVGITFALFLLSIRWILQPLARLQRVLEETPQDDLLGALERLTMPREVGLVVERMQAALRMAHKASEREIRFARGVAHELRNPVATIRANLDLPAMAEAPERPMRRLRRATALIQETIEGFLWLYRPAEAPLPALEPMTTSVKAAIETLEPLWQDRPVSLRLDTPGGSGPQVPGSLFRSVVGNLISNALRATAEGEITVTLEADGVRVRDSGSGLTHKEVASLLEGRGPVKDGAGFGVGSSIVRDICAQSGWGLAIDSVLGVGTTVTVRVDSE